MRTSIINHAPDSDGVELLIEGNEVSNKVKIVISKECGHTMIRVDTDYQTEDGRLYRQIGGVRTFELGKDHRSLDEKMAEPDFEHDDDKLSRECWRVGVRNEETILGYIDWVKHRLVEEKEEAEREERREQDERKGKGL